MGWNRPWFDFLYLYCNICQPPINQKYSSYWSERNDCRPKVVATIFGIIFLYIWSYLFFRKEFVLGFWNFTWGEGGAENVHSCPYGDEQLCLLRADTGSEDPHRNVPLHCKNPMENHVRGTALNNISASAFQVTHPLKVVKPEI